MHYNYLIRESQRRLLRQTGQEIIELASDTSAELEAVFDSSEQKLFDVTNKKTGRFDPKSIADSLKEVFDKIHDGVNPAYSTGLTNLDELIGGLIKQDLIVVAGMDYIQKLGDRSAGNRAQAIGKYSGACKDIAKMFDVPFVVLAQINRGVEGQSNKRPSMGDIKPTFRTSICKTQKYANLFSRAIAPILIN